jgi:hypothetical protein
VQSLYIDLFDQHLKVDTEDALGNAKDKKRYTTAKKIKNLKVFINMTDLKEAYQEGGPNFDEIDQVDKLDRDLNRRS